MSSQVARSGVSLRAYARHRGVAHATVQKAVRVGRLLKSIAVVDGVPGILSIEQADAEWEVNRSQAGPRRLQSVGRRAAPVTPVPHDQLSVFLANDVAPGLVMFATLFHGDNDRDYLVPMTPTTARRLAEHLTAAADQLERA